METFKDSTNHVVIIGAGTIGLSFAALHLQFLADPSQLTIHDTRADVQDYVRKGLAKVLEESQHDLISKIKLSMFDSTLVEALANGTIIQEQGPENVPFKTKIWKQIEEHASKTALFWSSTSGIAASIQSRDMADKSRLLVVHPFNPPHIMPLLELVPSPSTRPELIEQTLEFWRKRDRSPVVLHKETIGFVANRLAFALLRESIHMVNEGVVSVKDLDDIVTTSMGPRWSLAGPFKSYHAGGGAGGLRSWFHNIGGTVQNCWDDQGKVRFGGGDWEAKIAEQAEQVYGPTDTEERDRITRAVLKAVGDGKKIY
jgi:3-hydroxyacyl-CoA dehydrogenase